MAEEGVPQDPAPGMPTLGGMQFWGDLSWFRGFRIQRNVLTGSCRLLDALNRRYESGTLEACQTTLDQIRRARGLTPDQGHAVIYLHGIGRTSRSFRTMMQAFQRHDRVQIPFEYPSTRVSIRQSAEYLHSVITSLTGIDRISFVVHSMGGLVVRSLLAVHRDPRLYRMVMLGTPNHGAEMADLLRENFLFREIYGPAGQELRTRAGGMTQELPVPDFEFGIIAGGVGDQHGFNPLIPGDDDGTVTVASTRLEGAADFLRIPRLHSFLMSDHVAIRAVECFLEHGRFSNPAETTSGILSGD